MDAVTETLPAGKDRLTTYRRAQSADEVCRRVMDYCKVGWPQRYQVENSVVPYRGSLTIDNNLLLFNHRIVVPKSPQSETLKKIHAGHQGVERCRLRVRESVWWPGVSRQIEQLVQQCPVCVQAARLQTKPLKTSKLPDYIHGKLQGLICLN